MSYSSAVSLNYSPASSSDYQNAPIIPLLNPSSVSNVDSITTTTLTSGVVANVGNQPISTGIYAIRFIGHIQTTGDDVIVTNAYCYITLPAPVVSVQSSIIPCPVGGFEMVQNQQYWFSLSETLLYIQASGTVEFSVVVTYSSASGASVTCSGSASYVKLP
jgi:hypothetical protein